jgi:hypothetical protein
MRHISESPKGVWELRAEKEEKGASIVKKSETGKAGIKGTHRFLFKKR